jgi:transcriptional regulator with XRE-family HTH domain
VASESDRILSDFIDAWNAGERPDVDDHLARAPEAEREDLADALASFLAFAPTPAYSEQALAEIRAEPIVAEALDAGGERSGLMPALLRRLRERLGLSTEQLASELARVLGLGEERRPKTAAYLQRWERGELSSARVSQRVFDGLAGIFGVPRSELEGAADLGARVAPVFRASGPEAPAAAPHLELLADALQTPADAEHDEVDDLFLSGR